MLLVPVWAQGDRMAVASAGGPADTAKPHPPLALLPGSRTFTDADGLPQNSIMVMTTDADGYLWVGTQDGAAQYDGYRWRRVSLPGQGDSNWVRALLAASDGQLWFGSHADGLFVWHQGRFTRHYPAGQQGFPHNTVTALAELPTSDNRTTIWAGTLGGGLACFDGERWQTFTASNAGLPSDRIRALLASEQDGHPLLWVATEEGLVEWQDNRVRRLHSTATGLPANDIRALVEVRAPNDAPTLWVGFANHGVATYRAGRWTLVRTNFNGTPQVRSLLATSTPQGTWTLWVGTNGGGLAAYHQGEWTLYDTDSKVIPNSEVSSLYETRHGNGPPLLWVGTNGGGLARLRLGGWSRVQLPPSVIFTLGIKALLEYTEPDGSRTFWIGTRNHGAACLRGGRWEVFEPRNSSLPSRFVSCLCYTTKASAGPAVWFGTATGGLARLQNGRWTVFNRDNSDLPDNGVWSMLETEDTAGRPQLLIGTEKGIAVWQDGRLRRFEDGAHLPNPYVTALLATDEPTGSKRLWFGTFGGGLVSLYRGRWMVYDRAGGALPSDVVRSLHLLEHDGERTLWVGTYGGVAVGSLDNDVPTWQVLHDRTDPALPNNVAYELRHDRQGRIYVFTNRGVARLTRNQADGWRRPLVETFTTEDGLPSNECNGGSALCDANGRLWIGTVAGLAVFDPEQEITAAAAVPPRLTRVLIRGQESHVGGALELTYDQNEITFEYELPGFFRCDETRYATQLLGYDPEPTHWTTDRQRTFASLPPGTYTFRLRARDYLGRVQEVLMSSFTIHPPWWTRWWALTLDALVFVGLGLGLMQWRVYWLHKRTLELEAKVLERTAALASANQKLTEQNEKLAGVIQDLARKNEALAEAQRRTDLVFSALAEALPGTILDGKYHLNVKIGSGGFGVVYEATQLALNRKVAVKVFRPSPGNDSPQALERFRREGVSACRVNHPNAVAVLDSGVSAEGIAYLVMELLCGYTVADELKQYGKLSPARCAEILIPVLDVLDAAHAQGVIHRDIKPDNIFLHQAKDGEVVKVVDFGVAKLLEEEDVAQRITISTTNVLVGTAAYLAPERINHLAYDGKSDMYAVGVMLYQMLTGKLPFTSTGGFVGIALQHLMHQPHPIHEVCPDIPYELSQLVAQALEKDPAQRPTPCTMAVVLSKYLSQPSLQEGRGFPKVAQRSAVDDDKPTLTMRLGESCPPSGE